MLKPDPTLSLNIDPLAIKRYHDYKNQIRRWYLEPEFNFIGTRIFRELKLLGYTGSIGPIYRYLNSLKDEKRKINSIATDRIETPPGDQAQFDWAEYTVVVDHQIRQVYCFSMILSSSRVKDIVFSLAVDGDAIYEAIQDLFSSFGGVTKELLIDNPKALVIENKQGLPPKFESKEASVSFFRCFPLDST